jgi:periplasmic protein TonB
MTILRLFESDNTAAVQNATTSHLFDIPHHIERYRGRPLPYAGSAVLHAMAMLSMVTLGNYYLAQTPRAAPAPPVEKKVTHAFVLSEFGPARNKRPRAVRKTPRANNGPVAIVADATPPPPPPARGESPAPDTRPIVAEKPPRLAFDPPIPSGESRMPARRSTPNEAGLGSATTNVRAGLPTAEIRPGGFGEAIASNVRTDPSGFSTFAARAGIDDGAEGGGNGATPPRIQEPLPTPDYPAEARTRRLQGVVVLEVMLDASGKAHARRVMSDPLGFGIEEAARNAAERLKFTPARQGGRFVDAIVQVRVTFTLTGSATTVTGGA